MSYDAVSPAPDHLPAAIGSIAGEYGGEELKMARIIVSVYQSSQSVKTCLPLTLEPPGVYVILLSCDVDFHSKLYTKPVPILSLLYRL